MTGGDPKLWCESFFLILRKPIDLTTSPRTDVKVEDKYTKKEFVKGLNNYFFIWRYIQLKYKN